MAAGANKFLVTNFKSSVLTCYVGDDHCSVCNFLAGDRSIGTLLKVIEILDTYLADSEIAERRLQRALVALKENSELCRRGD